MVGRRIFIFFDVNGLNIGQIVEALAEIFDFVAGLVQRVPNKASIAKLDLQNSTARLWNLNFHYGN